MIFTSRGQRKWIVSRFGQQGNKEAFLAHLFVRHPVKDYALWRVVYDEADALRDQHGVRSSAVYRSADDPNDITVMHGFDTIEAARGLASDPALREAMDRAGVVGPPTIWFVDEA